MKIRLLLQIGAYHKTKADPDADFLQLSQSLESILDWATMQTPNSPRVRIHRLADGTTNLVEWEWICYKELS
mgnify:CR=1 FL=1